MSNQFKFYLRKLTLAYYSFRYSERYHLVMPIVLIFFGVIIFVVIILPQLQSWFSIRDEVEATQRKINTMRQNAVILENSNKYNVDQDFVTATAALPNEKNFAGILKAISQAASNSQVSLQDYEFSLGNIEGNNNPDDLDNTANLIQVLLSLDGSVNDLNQFISEVEKKLPLSQVKSINYSENNAQIILLFFIKPMPVLNITYSDQISGITQPERSVLNALQQWME